MALAEQHTHLLEAAHLGDPAALERLLYLCTPDIRRYAQRHCMISDVDDAVQDTLMILARRMESIRSLAAFSGWLFKVVQRECRRLGRYTMRYDPYDEEALANWLVTHTNDTLRLELVGALEALPEHYRDVILMRDFNEMTIAEIAEELKMTTAATKSRLHRARELTREYLLG